jgi:hypothetical protein
MEALIRGSVSFGAMLNKCGLSAIPSPEDPKPHATNYYYGGYISKCHSSLADPTTNINCIQTELPASMRSPTTYANSAKVFARALFEFYRIHSFHK